MELYIRSPCLHPIFGPAFIPYPLSLSVVSLQRNAAETQHLMHKVRSRLIILVVVQVGAVKIYVAAVEWRRASEEKGKTV
jgi:hypothetical protein